MMATTATTPPLPILLTVLPARTAGLISTLRTKIKSPIRMIPQR